jgi:hypothetical protein
LHAFVRGAALSDVQALRVSAPVITLQTGSLLAASIRFPEPTLSVLTAATRSALEAHAVRTASVGALGRLASQRTITVGSVLAAARDAAELAAREGATEQATAIEAITEEVTEVAANPTLERWSDF